MIYVPNIGFHSQILILTAANSLKQLLTAVDTKKNLCYLGSAELVLEPESSNIHPPPKILHAITMHDICDTYRWTHANKIHLKFSFALRRMRGTSCQIFIHRHKQS